MIKSKDEMKERYHQSALGQDGRRPEKGKGTRQDVAALLIFEWQVMVMGTWQIGVAMVSVDVVSHR